MSTELNVTIFETGSSLDKGGRTEAATAFKIGGRRVNELFSLRPFASTG
jgi:hypothetical protein